MAKNKAKFSALGLKNTSGLNIKFSWLKIIKRAKLATLNTGGAKVQQKTCVYDHDLQRHNNS